MNPEWAVRKANEKFTKRFRYVEESIKKAGKTLEEASPEEMNELWEKAKREEKE